MEQTSLFATEAGKTVELSKKPSAVIATLLRELKRPREREVLIKRHSLDGRGIRILEDIGKEYGITRERVRQIEKSALGRLKEISFDDGGVIKAIFDYLQRKGGLSEKEEFMNDLASKEDSTERSSLEFLILLNDNIKDVHDENLVRDSYVLSEIPDTLVMKLVKEYVAYLEMAKTTRTSAELVGHGMKVLEQTGNRGVITGSGLISLLTIAKPIIRSDADNWGLATWREINPKSIKDKTYYIMKKMGKPMHFAEIADEIRNLSFDRRNVTKQAVHNELIRDPRFVLIGRGIYALSEWGYEPGTVADVITDILKDRHIALHKNEIVKEVMKRRKVKETTIILNLQNKKLFRRVAKATYALAGGGS